VCDITDNDHDEPYSQYVVPVTPENFSLFKEFTDAGHGIIKLNNDEKRNYCLIDDFHGYKKKVKIFNFFESQ